MVSVANQVSVNYTWFSEKFKEQTGVSFNDYLKRLRIEEAESLLEKGTYPDNYSRRERKYERSTICSEDGRFSFAELPNLPFIVVIHIAWNEDATELTGLSATGRATISALKMNRRQMVRVRKMWVAMGEHPPDLE